MADIAGFRFDIGDLVDFFQLVRKFDLARFVVDADGFDVFLAGDVEDDLVDIVPGVGHHGVVGAQFDGVAEPYGFIQNLVGELVVFIADIEKGPDAILTSKVSPAATMSLNNRELRSWRIR